MFNWTLILHAPRSSTTQIYFIFSAILNSLFLVISAIFIFKSIKHLSSRNKNNLLFYSGLIYFIVSAILLILSFPININCSNDDASKEFYHRYYIIHKAFYGIQNYLLLILWFIRLYFVFADTAFKLSKYTMIVISTSAIIGFIGLIWSMTGFEVETRNANNAACGALIAYFAWFMLLIFMFIFKLIQVYKHINKTDVLIKVITKNTILSMISITSTLVYAVMLRIAFCMEHQIHIDFIRDLVQLISIFINFMCVVLSYGYFENYYEKVFGKTHIKCTKCWYKVIGDDIDPNVMQQIKLNSPPNS